MPGTDSQTKQGVHVIRENFGSSFRTHLVTVVVIALAVPSLWAQKKKMPERLPSVNEIQQSLQKEADTTAVLTCTALPIGPPPAGYYAGTNKCSSSNANYGSGNSINATVGTCSDKGGVEGTWALGMGVAQVGLNYLFTVWDGGGLAGGNVENLNPDIYTLRFPKFHDVTLTLKRNESIFGLEVNNTGPQNYTVTFHTTAGDVTSGQSYIGGESGPDPGAQHFIAICNAVAITGVTVHCDDCSLSSGPTAVAQIRGDKFPGF
jgi:hypothetical protein